MRKNSIYTALCEIQGMQERISQACDGAATPVFSRRPYEPLVLPQLDFCCLLSDNFPSKYLRHCLTHFFLLPIGKCLQELSLWDINSSQSVPLVSKVACHQRAITGFDWSNHQEHVMATVSFDSDSLVHLWDMRDASQPLRFHSLRSPFGGASAVKWSRREEYLIAATNGNQLLVWDVRKEAAPIVAFPADLKPLVDFDWSYRDDLQLLTCAPNSIKFWNLSNPKKPLSSFTTATNRARYCPFARSCVTLTGLSDHSWDLWNISDISAPSLVKEYGIDDVDTGAKSIGPLSKFNWRRSLIGSTFEYQLVTWSTKDQLLSIWCIEAEEMEACRAEPSKLKRSWSAKNVAARAKRLQESEEYLSMASSHEDDDEGFDDADYDDGEGRRRSMQKGVSASSLTDWSDTSSQASSSAGNFSLAIGTSITYSSDSDTGGPPGSGRLWDGTSRDSLDGELVAHHGRSRSRTNSINVAINGSQGELTTPPGSHKTSGSSRRSHSSGGGTPLSARLTLSRPVTFDVEINHIMKHPIPGLSMDKFDKLSRVVIFSLRHGKTHAEIKITFPTMYPHGAPPSFTVLTNTSAESTFQAKALLSSIAVDCVSMNKNCLRPALTQLVEYIKTQDNAVMEAASIESNAEDVEAALTRDHQPHSTSQSHHHHHHQPHQRRTSLSASNPHPSVLLPLSILQTMPSSHSTLAAPTTPGGTPKSPRHAELATGQYTEYIVKPTDSLAAIALFFNMTVGELRRLNKIQHSIQLLPGQILLVKRLPPAPLVPPPTQQPVTPLAPSSTAPKSAKLKLTTPSPKPPTQEPQQQSEQPHRPHATTHRPHSSSFKDGMSPHQLHHSSPIIVPQISKEQHQTETADSQPLVLSPVPERLTPRNTGNMLEPADPKPSSSVSPSIPMRRLAEGDSFLGSSPSPSLASLIGSPVFKSRAKLFEGPGMVTAVAPAKKEEIALYALQCKFIDRTVTPPVLVAGILTATPSNLFFEPDLEQPMVEQRGALHYSIFLEMKKIREASHLKSMNLSLAAADDEGTGVYLQVLTKDVQQVNHSKVLLFLTSSQSKTEEMSQALKRWISSQTEKSLVDTLGLDTRVTPPAPAFTQTLGAIGTAVKGADRSVRSNVAGDIMGAPGGKSTSPVSNHAIAGPIPTGVRKGSASMPAHKPEAASSPETSYSFLESIAASLGFTSTPTPPPMKPHPKPPRPTHDAQGRPIPKDLSATPAHGGKILAGAPNEDPDDLPALMGEGELLTTESMWTLRMHVPNRFKFHDWHLAFSTSVHGTSLLTFYRQLDEKAPSVIVIRDTDGHVFGGYASEAWRVSKTFFGTGESFLFSLFPTFAVYHWTGADDFYLIAKKDFIAMGGGGTSGRYGLWLDSELSAGTSEVCKTFLNRRLSLNEEFTCSVVEVYTLSPK